jgi:hypothetical protein
MFRVFLCRYLLWLFPLVQAWLWWQNIIAFPFFIAAYTISFAVPLFFAADAGKRQLLFYAVFYFMVFAVIEFLVLMGEQLFWNRLPLLFITFNLNLLPLIGVLTTITLIGYMCRRFPFLLQYEFILRFLAMAGAFWAMSEYQILFYTSPLSLLFYTVCYIFMETFNFILIAHQKHHFRKLLPLLAITALIIIPVLLLLPLTFKSVNDRMTQNHSGLIEPNLTGGFDFSQNIKLETNISLGKDLLLFMRTETPIAQKTLIKRFTLAGYDPDKGFFRMEGLGEIEELLPYSVLIQNPEYKKRVNFTQEFYLINLSSTSLVAASYPYKIVPFKNWNKSSFNRVYQVNSYISAASESELTAASSGGGLTGEELAVYLKTSEDAEVNALAASITAGLTSPYAKAAAINDFLKNNYFYSLSPGETLEKNGDQLKYFLFESKKGYCSYFAFSMALMARSVGIPSRIATGFFALPENAMMGFYPIHSDAAHAWVEIYLDNYGWISFDPTSDIPAPTEFNLGSANDATEYYSLLEEIMRNRTTKEPMQELARELTYEQTPSALQAFINHNKSLLILTVVIFLIALYLVLLRLHVRSLAPHANDASVLRTRKLIRLLFIRCKLLSPAENNFYRFLDKNTELKRLYRQALFSSSFTETDFQVFYQVWSAANQNQKHKETFFSKIYLFITPLWFTYRRPQ